jgi:tetratricopeptide (TPR) repeat protein
VPLTADPTCEQHVESVISQAAPDAIVPHPTGTRLANTSRMSMRSALVTLCLSLVGASIIHAQSAVVELHDAGWKMLERGEGARAAQLFAEALALEPGDPALLFGAGAAAHLDGRPKDATAHLRRALEFNPRLTPASLLLGEIAYAEGDVAVAITTYENALKYAPS